MRVNVIDNSPNYASTLNANRNSKSSINSKKIFTETNNPSFSSSVAKEFSVIGFIGALALCLVYYITHQ